jgi:DNA-binding NtrC family response regulator
MIIMIDDSLTGYQRQQLIELLLIKYALNLFNGNKTLAHKWIGISRRTLTEKIRFNPELKKWKVEQAERGRYIQKPRRKQWTLGT